MRILVLVFPQNSPRNPHLGVWSWTPSLTPSLLKIWPPTRHPPHHPTHHTAQLTTPQTQPKPPPTPPQNSRSVLDAPIPKHNRPHSLCTPLIPFEKLVANTPSTHQDRSVCFFINSNPCTTTHTKGRLFATTAQRKVRTISLSPSPRSESMNKLKQKTQLQKKLNLQAASLALYSSLISSTYDQ